MALPAKIKATVRRRARSDSLVDVQTVEPSPEGQRRLTGFHLDAPRAGAGAEQFVLELRGWAVGRESRVKMGDVFPGLREDPARARPAHTLCSILAYKLRPQAVLVREDPGMDEGYLDRIARSFEGMLGYAAEAGDRTAVVRYEDLLLDPVPTLRRILDHVGLDRSQNIVERMIDEATAGSPALQRHRTAGSVRGSVGRWREEMDPELRARAGQAFRDVIERLGYA